ncbi:hypothetical protein [Streptococcus mitis]|uniref:hypothetical protein n=1 Tax=Streptococcus mitis TaxID=28037 RepID=UPI0039C4DA93
MSDKFKDYGVSTIIAIDDIFNDINEEDKLEKFLPEVIDDLTGGQYDFFRDYTISEYIDELGEDDFIEKLKSSLDQIEHYKCFQSDNIDFKKIGADYSQVEKAIDEIDATDKSRKHLILLDRTLQNPVIGLGNNDVFVDILKLIHSKLREKNLLLLIYTDSNTPEELNSFAGAKKYLTDLKLDKNIAEQLVLHFNYVKKTEELSVDFFDNILKSQKANYISEYKNIFEESYSKLTERLWQLNQNQVLFYYDYINEGQHVDSIIYETFLTKFKQVYSDTFNKENNHKELINPIRRSMQHHLPSLSSSQIDVYRNLKEFEMNLNGQNNLLKVPESSDISFGDVIKISDKYYMIMSQDCDITIRNNKKRKLFSVQMVEIKEQSEEISEQYLYDKYRKLLRKDGFATGLNKLGISNDTLDNVIQAKNDEELCSEQINELYINSGFKAFPKNIISINGFWLDCLTLRKNVDKEVEFTSSNLNTSHEVRYATLNYLRKCLNCLLDKLKNTDKDTVDQIVKFSLSNLNIEIESEFDNSELIGFKLKNITRIGRLDRLDAMIILKSVLEDSSRIPEIHNLLL